MKVKPLTNEAARVFYSAISCLALATPFQANAADILTFCLSAPPTDPATLSIYNTQCPSFLQTQFSNSGTVAQNADRTSQIAQDQTQLAMITAIAALIKPPPAQVATGLDISALGAAGLKKDAELTYGVASKIGTKLSGKVSADSQAVLLTNAELVALASAPVDSATVRTALDDYTTRITPLKCSGAATPAVPAILPAAMAIYGAQALLSTVASVANMFQPSLLAAGKTASVAEPQSLMAAGLLSGVSDDKRAFVRVGTPSISNSNSILASLGLLRVTISGANQRLAGCAATDSTLKSSAALVSEAKEFIAALLKTDGTKPSLLDLAARRAAMTDAKIRFVLVLSRDVSGGGIAAVKENWFSATSLLFGTAVGISYRLLDFEGRTELSGFESDSWADRCSVAKWASSFQTCNIGKQ